MRLLDYFLKTPWGLIPALAGARFGKDVTVLAGGTFVAQAIVAVTSIFLARVYSPDDFGVLLVFCSLLDFLVVFSSFRYELAIPLTADPKDAVVLLLFSIALVLASSLVLAALILLVGDRLAKGLHNPGLGQYLWLLPIGLFAAGSCQALTYWALRRKHFAILSSARVLQSGARVAFQMLAGCLKDGPLGLIAGHFLGFFIAALSLLKAGFSDTAFDLIADFPRRAKDLARRYRRFPQISSISALINSAGLTAPFLLFATFYGSTVTGCLALSQRTVTIPMVLIGQAVAQVYFSQGAALVRNDPRGFHALFTGTGRSLFWLGLAPTAILILGGPFIFGVAFGSQWSEAGRYVQILALGYLGQLIVAPISQTLNLLERQDLQLVWDVVRLFLNLSALCLSWKLGGGPFAAVCAYSGAMILGYAWLHLLCKITIEKAILNNALEYSQARRSSPTFAARNIDP